jgi:hypothetical protein
LKLDDGTIRGAITAATAALYTARSARSRRRERVTAVDFACAEACDVSRGSFIGALGERLEQGKRDHVAIDLLAAKRRKVQSPGSDVQQGRSELLYKVVCALAAPAAKRDKKRPRGKLGVTATPSSPPPKTSKAAFIEPTGTIVCVNLPGPPTSMPPTPPKPRLDVEEPHGGFGHAGVDGDVLKLLVGLFEDQGLDSYLGELAAQCRYGETKLAIRREVLDELESILRFAGRDWFMLLRPSEAIWRALRDLVNERVKDKLGLDVDLLPSPEWLRKNVAPDLARLKANLKGRDAGGSLGCSVTVNKVYALQNLLAIPSTRAVLLAGIDQRAKRVR